MDSFRAIAQAILNRVTGSLGTADPAAFVKLVEALSRRRNVFITGEDRADAVARAFTRSLSRLGRPAFLVGEPAAPPVARGDLLIALSADASSSVLAARMDLVRRATANTVLVTADPNAPLLRQADLAILLTPASRTPYTPAPDPDAAWLLFSQALLVYLDAVALALTQFLGHPESPSPGPPLS